MDIRDAGRDTDLWAWINSLRRRTGEQLRDRDSRSAALCMAAWKFKPGGYGDTDLCRKVCTENFARGKRYGVFPAGAVGWVITQERFMRGVKWLDHLKLRASYGLVGNDQLSGNRFSYLQYYKSSDGMTTYFGESA